MAPRKSKDGKGKAYGGGRGGPGCLSFILLVLLILAAVGATVAIFFKINRIEVIGTERYTPEDVRVASGVEQGDNLFLFNKFEAISKIFVQLPYVDEIRMSRDFPDTLLIDVTECTAAAYLFDAGSYWLLSSDGKILEQKSELGEEARLIEIQGVTLIEPELGKIAELRGIENTTDTGQTDTGQTPDSAVTTNTADSLRTVTMTDTMAAIIESGLAKDVSAINVEKIYNVTFRYLGRFDVELGMPEDLAYKMDYLKKIVEQLEANETGAIDLSKLIEDGKALFIPDQAP